jgi:hypothetical protein
MKRRMRRMILTLTILALAIVHGFAPVKAQ